MNMYAYCYVVWPFRERVTRRPTLAKRSTLVPRTNFGERKRKKKKGEKSMNEIN